MSQHKPLPINADDPGLTAFALGELEGADAARYVEACAASPELRVLVSEIQAEAQQLVSELHQESPLPLTPECRAEIVAQATRPQPKDVARRFNRSKALQYVSLGATSVIAGAVCFGLFYPDLASAPSLGRPKSDLALTEPNWEARHLVASTGPWKGPVDALGTDVIGDGIVRYEDNSAPVSRPRTATDFDGSQIERRPLSVPASITGPALADSLPVVSSRVRTASDGTASVYDPAVQKSGVLYGSRGIESSLKEFDKPYKANLSYASGDKAEPQSARAGQQESGSPKPQAEQAGARDASERFGNSKAEVAEAAPEAKHRGFQKNVNEMKESLSEVAGLQDAQKGYKSASPATQPAGSSGSESRHRLEQLSKASGPSARDGEQLATSESARSSNGKPTDFNVVGKPAQTAPLASSKPGVAGATTSLSRPQAEGKPSVSPVFGGFKVAFDKPTKFNFTEEKLTLADLERGREQRSEGFNVPHLKTLKESEQLRQRVEDPTSDEAYKPIYENSFISAAEQPLSTFSIDVDTASYANLRRFLQNGQLPPPDAVRIEELVNYFAYQYPQPQDGRPFSVQTDIAACPWQPSHQLVRIGLKGKEIPKEQRPPTNLVFLVDVSGSMSAANKLPLVRESLKTLVNQLDERDKIAIVTYAGEAGLRLASTSVAQRETVIAAINSLGAGGSTNGAAGINTAYDIAAQEFLDKGANRVILCTDGDFNVGVTSDEALVQMIQTRAKGGVFLSVFGFGMGNLKDAKLEQLADKGNGQYGYIDDQQEANKVFVEELMGTLVTIAKDVKIQIDFNKETVASYRLVGYENRVMAAEDFHNDKKDAGEIGSGHTVTALYEIVPTKDLKVEDQTRWLTVKLRYKQPEASESVLFENPLVGQAGQLKLAPSDFQFAASVAACGMLLRHSQYAGQANWGLVKELAQTGLSYDPHGHRRGYLSLVAQAESLMGQLRPASPLAPESTVRGKYKSLLRKLNAPEDAEKYGQFNDYGYADTRSWAGVDNLPAGYWVYIAPHWYIWAETTETTRPSEKRLGE